MLPPRTSPTVAKIDKMFQVNHDDKKTASENRSHLLLLLLLLLHSCTEWQGNTRGTPMYAANNLQAEEEKREPPETKCGCYASLHIQSPRKLQRQISKVTAPEEAAATARLALGDPQRSTTTY
jgi:hypothetical protein